ncbi:MAG: hypothetical protein ACUVQ8_06580, partial [Nitrososphaeria archaeon]
MTFASMLSSGSGFYVNLLDALGNAVSSGSHILDSDLPGGAPLLVSTTPAESSYWYDDGALVSV